MPRNNVKSIGVEELKKRLCKYGHNRSDAYVHINPFTSKIVLICKTCAKNFYQNNKTKPYFTHKK